MYVHVSTRCKVYFLYLCDQAESYHFRGRRKRTAATNASHSMTSDHGSMPAQRMTSDWQIVNRCQLNSFQRPDTRWRHREFTDEFDTGSSPSSNKLN